MNKTSTNNTPCSRRSLVLLLVVCQALVLTVASSVYTACSSIDCSVSSRVYTRYTLLKPTGVADTLRDTLWVHTVRRDGRDTLVLNAAIGLTKLELPISYSNPEDTLFFNMHGMDGYSATDTVWLKKENYPHFESVDCNVTFFHTVTDVRCTHNALDSISINYPEVNYDTKTEHFYIYFKDRR